MEKTNSSDVLRVHVGFKKRIENFIDEFFKQKGITISTTQATKILNDKIGRQGGLKVE